MISPMFSHDTAPRRNPPIHRDLWTPRSSVAPIGAGSSGPIHSSSPIWLGWVVGLGLALVGLPAVAQEPVRMAMEALGTEAQIEVRNLDRSAAEGAIQAAMKEIYQLQLLLDPDQAGVEGGFGALQAAAGQEVALESTVAELLSRALRYCFWSHNAYGPLGGELQEMWLRGDRTGERATPSDLRDAVSRADCSNLVLRRDGERLYGKLQDGSRLSGKGVAQGFAVDRAMDVLLLHGANNAFVEIGHVVRGMGPGPDGNGWLVAVPGHAKTRNPLDQFWLVNQSLSVVNESGPRRIDQRRGVPGLGVVQVAAVSELAVDTEVLTHALFISGLSAGQRLIGFLNPRPSIFWLMGNGTGSPLESQYRWSELSRPRRAETY